MGLPTLVRERNLLVIFGPMEIDALIGLIRSMAVGTAVPRRLMAAVRIEV
jgi:hypothetical protein